MTLSFYCSSCKKNNKIKVKATNRFDLQKELGDEVNVRCKNCGTINKKHINRLTADPNYTLTIIALVGSVFITILFWNMGFIAKISFALPIWIYFDALKKASLFNKTMISRKKNS